jgi:hypothetical protein
MEYQFTKEPGNMLPFEQKKAGTVNDLPAPLQGIMQDMVSRPEAYKQAGTQPSADSDNYNLKIDHEGKQVNFSFRDLEIPENATPLIDYLRQQAK